MKPNSALSAKSGDPVRLPQKQQCSNWNWNRTLSIGGSKIGVCSIFFNFNFSAVQFQRSGGTTLTENALCCCLRHRVAEPPCMWLFQRQGGSETLLKWLSTTDFSILFSLKRRPCSTISDEDVQLQTTKVFNFGGQGDQQARSCWSAPWEMIRQPLPLLSHCCRLLPHRLPLSYAEHSKNN